MLLGLFADEESHLCVEPQAPIRLRSGQAPFDFAQGRLSTSLSSGRDDNSVLWTGQVYKNR